VTTAGGPLYFLNAYLNFALLREKGCRLPIEWAYLGAEMKPAWIAEAEGLGGVRMIDLGGTSERCNKSLGGWQSKIRAVLASSFEDVLFLDADSFPRADPTFLFDRPEYTGNAAALWGDVKPWEPDRAAYLNGRFGITLPTRQCESGQLMVNKTRAAAMLWEVERLHQEPDLYRVIFGDKDSWMIAALRTGTPYHFQLGLRGCRGGIMQPDFDGNGFFAHLTNGKFQWDQLPRTNERALPGVGRLVAIQQELDDRLYGAGRLGVLPPPFTREGRRAAALVGRR
jgi:alpha 1,2-mannosyltransferase